MDAQSLMSAPTYAEFLEQAKLAQAVLKTILATIEMKDDQRDDDVVRLVINKAIKTTVRHCLCFKIYLIFTFSSFRLIILRPSSRTRSFKRFLLLFARQLMNYTPNTPVLSFRRISANSLACTRAVLISSRPPNLAPRKVCLSFCIVRFLLIVF